MILGISGKQNSGKDTVGAIIQYLVWRTYYMDNVTYHNFPVISEGHFEEFRNSLIPERSDWKIVKFADKLKDIVCILLGCTREQLEDREFKETQLGEEWTKYSKVNGFWSHSDTNPSHKMMDSIQCDKETYEAEKRINWQTAYMTEYTPRVLLQYIGTDLLRKQLFDNIWVNATMVDYKSKFRESDDFIHTELPDGGLVKWKDNPTWEPTHYPNWIITDVRFPNEAKVITDKGGINIRLQRKSDTNDGHDSETALDKYKFDYVINNDSTIEELILRIKEILLIEKII